MSAVWHGGLSGTEQYTQDARLKAAISRAMDYWFGRDFEGTACVGRGGAKDCPCDNLNNWLWWVLPFPLTHNEQGMVMERK